MAAVELEQLLERHEAFWNGEGETALRRVTEHRPLSQSGGVPLADGSRAEDGKLITPESIDPSGFYRENSGPQDAVNGDFIVAAGPPHLCWTEAIMGCPVRVEIGGPWAEPTSGEWRDLKRLEADERWLEKLDAFVDLLLDAFVDLLVERARGNYPIVQPLLRGPVDMMASFVGHERMCLALVEEPETSEAFLDRCADIFIQTATRRLDHTPKFAGGYLSSYGIWAPGPVVRTQLDNATMLSPALYRERVLEADRRVIEAFEFPLIHVHSGCLHIADVLLSVEALKVIQVSIDFPGGPLATEVMPILQKIVQKKPLVVTGPVTREELAALERLEPQGRLCMLVEIVQGT